MLTVWRVVAWLLCWSVLLLSLKFLRTTFPSVAAFFNRHSVTLSPLVLTAVSTRGSAALVAAAAQAKRFLRWWFFVGGAVGILAQLCAVLALVWNLVTHLQSIAAWLLPERIPTSEHAPILTIALPGLTFPIGDVLLLWGAVFAGVFFHETGHALCAAVCGVRPKSFGVFFACFFPGAFVQLDEEKFAEIKPWPQLQIASAGIWHNLVLCGTMALLFISTPFLFSFAFTQHSAPSVACASPALRASVPVHALLVSLDDLPLQTPADWRPALTELQQRPQRGYCVKQQHVHNSSSFTGMCYEAGPEVWCQKARELLLHASSRCQNRSRDAQGTCGDDEWCVWPELKTNERVTRLGWRGEPADGTQVTLFAGSPAALGSQLTLSEFRARPWWRVAMTVPLTMLAWVDVVPCTTLPQLFQRALRHLFIVSASIALLNAAPCHLADGAFVFRALAKRIPSLRVRGVLEAGSVLMACNLLAALYTAFTAS